MSSTQSARAASELPVDLQAIVNDLAKSEVDARKVVQGLSDAQLNWQPNNGAGWSIAQCVDHLAKTNKVYTDAMRSAMQEAKRTSAKRRPIQPGWLERYFIKSMDAPSRRKFTAPKKVVPASSQNSAQVLAEFIASHDEIRSLIASSTEIDLNRIRFKNPFFGIIRFTVGAGLLIITAHDRRHVWQAKQVRTAMQP